MTDDSKRLQPGDRSYETHMDHCFDNDPMAHGGYLSCKYGDEDACPMAPVAVERARTALRGQRPGDGNPFGAVDVTVWRTRSGTYVAAPSPSSRPGIYSVFFFPADGAAPQAFCEGQADAVRAEVLYRMEAEGELLDAAQPLLLRERDSKLGLRPPGP
jgi:hypothetical protein